jgi:hypothetical protein
VAQSFMSPSSSAAISTTSSAVPVMRASGLRNDHAARTAASGAGAESSVDAMSPFGVDGLVVAPYLKTSTGRPMRSSIWIGILIGSTIGGLIPGLWGDGMLSYSSVLLSGVGAFVGLWIGFKLSN